MFSRLFIVFAFTAGAATALAIDGAAIIPPEDSARDFWARPADVPPPEDNTKASHPPLTGGIINPSFETATGNVAASWVRGGSGEIRTTNSAHGNNHAWVSARHNQSQRFMMDIPTWQSFALVGSVYAEYSGFPAPVYLETYGTAQKDPTYLTVRDPSTIANTWAPFAQVYTKIEGAETLLMLLRQRVNDWWTGIDNLTLIYEGLGAPGFSNVNLAANALSGWALEGTTNFESNEARFPTVNDGMEQLVACTPWGVTYFLSGEVTSGTLTIVESVLDSRQMSIATGISISASASENAEFFGESNPIPANAHLARVQAFAVEADSRLADFSRGWTSAWPPIFEPVENAVSPTVRLTAAWPDRLASCYIRILNSEGTEVAVLDEELNREGTSAWFEYDGAGLPAGVYTAEFVMTNESSRTVRPQRTFELRRGEAFTATPSAAQIPGYQRMAWLFLDSRPEDNPVDTPEAVANLVRMAEADGFNMVFLIGRTALLPAFKAALEETGTPFMIGCTDFAIQTIPVAGNATFDPYALLPQLELFTPFRDMPGLRGIYVADETNQDDRIQQRTQRFMRLMEREGWPMSVGYIHVSFPPASLVYPIHLAQYYPFARAEEAPGAALIRMATDLEKAHIPHAINQGRDFWTGVQGFGVRGGATAPTARETSAMLATGLAIGSQGYYTFVYTTVTTLGGIRTSYLEETPRLAAYREFNQRTAALSPLIESFVPGTEIPTQNGVLARVARNEAGERFMYLVSLQPEAATNVRIAMDDIASFEDVESGEAESNTTEVVYTVPPGGWRLIAITGDAAIQSVDAEELTPLPQRSIHIPQVASILSGTSNRALSISPNGRLMVSLSGANWRLHDLTHPTIGQVFREGFADTGPGRVGFLSDTEFFVGNSSWGITVYTMNGNTPEVLYDHTRRTAGGIDLLQVGPIKYLASHSYMGAHLLQSVGNGTLQRNASISIFPTLMNTVGPFANGNLVTVDTIHGLHRLEVTEDSITGTRTTPSAHFGFASLSPNGQELAVGRVDHGWTVYQLDASGNPISQQNYKGEELATPEIAAWIGDNLIAIGDVRRGVHVYTRTATATNPGFHFLGTWKPRDTPFSIESIATHPSGLIAVGTQNNQIILGNMSYLLDAAGATGWQISGDETP